MRKATSSPSKMELGSFKKRHVTCRRRLNHVHHLAFSDIGEIEGAHSRATPSPFLRASRAFNPCGPFLITWGSRLFTPPDYLFFITDNLMIKNPTPTHFLSNRSASLWLFLSLIIKINYDPEAKKCKKRKEKKRKRVNQWDNLSTHAWIMKSGHTYIYRAIHLHCNYGWWSSKHTSQKQPKLISLLYAIHHALFCSKLYRSFFFIFSFELNL